MSEALQSLVDGVVGERSFEKSMLHSLKNAQSINQSSYNQLS